jgi:hypothetical protein
VFRREAGVGREIVERLFGRWGQLRKELGLSGSAPRGRAGVEAGVMVERLKSVAAAEGGDVSESRFFEVTGWTRGMVRTQFGSWSGLRSAAGLGVRVCRVARYSEEMMLEDLFAVWERTGKWPDYRRHDRRGGRIRARTIRARFGGWDVVKAAFGVYRLERLIREGKLSADVWKGRADATAVSGGGGGGG